MIQTKNNKETTNREKKTANETDLSWDIANDCSVDSNYIKGTCLLSDNWKTKTIRDSHFG